MLVFIYKCTFLVLMMKVLQCQESPCPTIFQYKNDNNCLYGRIEVPYPDDENNMVKLRVQLLSIANLNCTEEILHENTITFLGSATDLILKKALVFRLDFPPSCDILPRVTLISVNNISLCSATTIQENPVTTINLYRTITLIMKTPPHHQLNDIIDKNHSLQSKSSDFHKVNGSPQPTPDFKLYVQHVRFSSSKTSVSIYELETVPKTGAVKKYLNDCGHSKFLADQKTEIQKGTYPWMGALFRRDLASPMLLCGASLISPKLALTAGHCVAPHLDAKLYLTFGNTNLLNWFDDDVQIAKIQAVKFHPEFRNDSADADLAILIFVKELVLTPVVQPVCLWNSDDSREEIDKKTGIVVDWNKNDSFEIMQHLLQNYAVVANKDECLQSSIRITSNRIICAKIRNNSDVCNNYGGSGFYLWLNGRWTIRGIVSRYLLEVQNNETCNFPQRVTLLDVAKYIDWIDTFI